MRPNLSTVSPQASSRAFVIALGNLSGTAISSSSQIPFLPLDPLPCFSRNLALYLTLPSKHALALS